MATTRQRLNAGIAELGEKMILAARDLSDPTQDVRFAGNTASDVRVVNASILNPTFKQAYIDLISGRITTVAGVQALLLSLEEKALLRASFGI